MKPNIDRNGRIARAISGLLCIAFAVTVSLIAWPESQTFRWVLGLAGAAAGGFQLFEAKRGWCIMRACGVRTPI